MHVLKKKNFLPTAESSINRMHSSITKNGSLRDSSINWISLWGPTIQNQSKTPVNESKWNKVKYLSWNSVRPKFVKTTSMPNPIKSLRYMKQCYKKCYILSSPRYILSLSDSIRNNCQIICLLIEKTRKRTGNQRKGKISRGDQPAYYLQVFQRFYWLQKED